MVKSHFPTLALAIFFVTGCTVTSEPLMTQSDVKTLLQQNQSYTDQTLRAYCDAIGRQQARQQASLDQIQATQRSTDQQISDLHEQISQQPDPIVIVQQEKETQECPVVAPAQIDGKMILGRTEWIWLEAINQTFRARVDSGATTSSLSARDIVEFERDGQRWVRFNIIPDDDTDDNYEVEAPLVRIAKVRQASAEETDRRVVVQLTVKIGDFVDTAEFTLTDRSAMTYPILLGREFLRDIALIDVAKSYHQPKPEPLPERTQVDTSTSPKLSNNHSEED